MIKTDPLGVIGSSLISGRLGLIRSYPVAGPTLTLDVIEPGWTSGDGTPDGMPSPAYSGSGAWTTPEDRGPISTDAGHVLVVVNVTLVVTVSSYQVLLANSNGDDPPSYAGGLSLWLMINGAINFNSNNTNFWTSFTPGGGTHTIAGRSSAGTLDVWLDGSKASAAGPTAEVHSGELFVAALDGADPSWLCPIDPSNVTINSFAIYDSAGMNGSQTAYAVGAACPAQQRVTISASGGTWKVISGGNDLAYNVSTADLETEIETQYGVTVSVTSPSSGVYDITWSDAGYRAPLDVDGSALTP